MLKGRKGSTRKKIVQLIYMSLGKFLARVVRVAGTSTDDFIDDICLFIPKEWLLVAINTKALFFVLTSEKSKS